MMGCLPWSRGQPMHLGDSGYLFKMGLWVGPIILQLLTAAMMVRRGLARQFKYFFAYCLCAPARDATLLFIQDRPNLYFFYFWIYWAGDGLLILLQVVVLCEVLRYLLPRHLGFRAVATRGFIAVVALSAALAFIFLATAVRGNGNPMEAILLLERSARAAQVMTLVIAMMFISHLGLTWRHYATGILLGSGIAGLQLVPAELRGSLHLISNNTFAWLKPAIYDCAVIAWAFYFVIPQNPVIGLSEIPQDDLNEWDKALRGYLFRQW